MSNGESTPRPTHMVVYEVYSLGRQVGAGVFDATLPAGWTPENREWCANHLSAQNGGNAVIITNVIRYDQ